MSRFMKLRERIARLIYPQTEENILRSEFVERLRVRLASVENGRKLAQNEAKRLRKKIKAMEETQRLNRYEVTYK